MSKTAFICICSEKYLNYYNVLYSSIKKYCPDSTQILYLIGETPIDNKYDFIVNINSWYNDCHPSYNRLEKICSLRALAVLDAFSKGYTEIVFTGAKVEFFADPFKLTDPLKVIQDPFNAVVTPHILKPLPEDGKFPSNASVSFTGHISTDIVSFRNCSKIIKFLEWQDEMLRSNCKTTDKTYLDQSWLNFLPFFVDNVKILRDQAYNQAYWNYEQRKDIKPVCFQYSGLDLNNPQGISTHQNRYKADGEYLKFLESYAERVKK